MDLVVLGEAVGVVAFTTAEADFSLEGRFARDLEGHSARDSEGRFARDSGIGSTGETHIQRGGCAPLAHPPFDTRAIFEGIGFAAIIFAGILKCQGATRKHLAAGIFAS